MLVLIAGCTNLPSEEDIRQQEYGELYATMDCWWSSNNTLPAGIFWCSDTLDTSLIKGYVSLAIETDLEATNYFSICGKDVTLNSGHDLHDTLIASMTNGTYNCYNAYETELGNVFDWIWDEDTATLQLIWRPEDEEHKVLTIFVPEAVDSPNVVGTVYYKTGIFN